MNIKKIICIMTVSCVISTGVISTAQPKVVHAAEVNSVTTNKIDMSKQNQSESVENAIKKIEKDFLKQNVDGTFYILDEAYNNIDSNTIDYVKTNMEEINDLVRSDILKFQISHNNGQAEVKVIQDNNDKTIKTREKRSPQSVGRIVSNYKYCSNYQWYWWGYSTKLNKTGCQLLQNEMEAELAIFGAGMVAVGHIPGSAPGAAAAAFGGAATYAQIIKELKNSKITGKARVVGVGKPASGHIWSVKAIH